jgi:hypothetical protein
MSYPQEEQACAGAAVVFLLPTAFTSQAISSTLRTMKLGGISRMKHRTPIFASFLHYLALPPT